MGVVDEANMAFSLFMASEGDEDIESAHKTLRLRMEVVFKAGFTAGFDLAKRQLDQKLGIDPSDRR